MLSFFKRRRTHNAIIVSFWNSVGEWIANVQRKGADYLGKRSERISGHWKWLLFFGFSICFGLGCACCFVAAFRKNTSITPVGRLSVPAYVTPHIQQKDEESRDFSTKELHRLQALARYADSLRDCGSPAYDSIVRNNPDFKTNLTELKQILETYKIR